MDPKVDFTHLCAIAQKAAIEAGEYIQTQVAGSYAQGRKAGGSTLASQVVTEVDLKAQEIILAHLAGSISQYSLGLLTEEATDDASRLTQAYFWCIDPMDGTLPFTEGRPGYSVAIALVSQAGDPVVGVVYIPDTATCYAAVKGQGVQCNQQPYTRPTPQATEPLQVYMDRSFGKAPYYEAAMARLKEWAMQQGRAGLAYHTGYGSVRNAIAVMTSGLGCYFKYPKPQPGGGSIWDFAATRLFFEELGLPVTTAQGQPLHLNGQETTFMHAVGVVYATHNALAAYILDMGQGLA